jgi:thymidylate synthase ThyX
MTDYSLDNLPQQNWNKKLEYTFTHEGKELKIYSVEPQAHLIGVTKPVGLLDGFSADAILVKAFEKNYKTPSKPKVVETYGFEQMHGEPIEMINFNYECIFDRAIEAEMNRYRHNSKNYESGRYVDYVKHGLTIVFPDDIITQDQKDDFLHNVVAWDLLQYHNVIKNGGKRQQARRRLGFYIAVESVFSINLRSLWHMGRQRSAELSPNGKEAEPQISTVVTQMVKQIEPYLPRFYKTLVDQIGKGYR